MDCYLSGKFGEAQEDVEDYLTAIDVFFEYAKTKFHYNGRNEVVKPRAALSEALMKNLKRAADDVVENDKNKRGRMDDL